MNLNVRKSPILYSMATRLAYNIAKYYYHNKHFVWCTTNFDADEQAPTSNPYTIGQMYLSHAIHEDRHSKIITNNIAGILRGANEKYKESVIDKNIYARIKQIVNCAGYDDFAPILFIIDAQKVREKCIEVPLEERASSNSIEYIIKDLSAEDFQIIDFRDFLAGVIKISEKRFGE